MSQPDEERIELVPEAPTVAARRPPPSRGPRSVVLPVTLAVVAVLAIAGGAAAFYYFNSVQAAAVAPAPGATVTADQAAPAKPVVAEAPAPAAPASSTAPAAPAEPAPEPKLTAERFDGWFVVCPEGQPNSPSCFIQQQLHSAQSKALVFMWIMRRDEQGVIHSVWQTPPGLNATRGMVLDAGDGTPQQVPIANCQPAACTVRGVFAPAYLTTLATAARITATITMQADGRALRYGFEPKGLQAALARLAGTPPAATATPPAPATSP